MKVREGNELFGDVGAKEKKETNYLVMWEPSMEAFHKLRTSITDPHQF
jgi:hypothetical protein